MRKYLVAGNWKMNGDYTGAMALFHELAERQNEFPPNVDVMIAPPFVFLKDIADRADQRIIVAAQNCADKESGAFTGEVSSPMLKSIGINHVIVGHSERRHIYGESNFTVTQKVSVLLKNNMVPIVCVGEELKDRLEKSHFEVVENQLISVFNLSADDFSRVIVAYEPVWAIGTGETATPEQAQEMHGFIREKLAEVFGSLVRKTRILYGGSVKPGNAAELFSKPDVDGGLVGGASLNADDFTAIIKAAGPLGEEL